MARFVALGRTRWILDAVHAAATRGHQPLLIATCPPASHDHSRQADFERLAAEHGCQFILVTSANDSTLVDFVERVTPDIGISVNWMGLIGSRLREACGRGIVNAHAGDLPRYRGNACPNWAILQGEREVTLTLHFMVDELDAGPIIKKLRFELDENTYIGDVYRFLDEQIPQGFVDVLDRLDTDSLQSTPQPAGHSTVLRTLPRTPEDGWINWNLPANKIARLVRATAEPFAGAFTALETHRLTIWRARPEKAVHQLLGVPGQVVRIERALGEVAVLAGDDLLILEEVEMDASGRVLPATVIRSTRTRLGVSPAKMFGLRHRGDGWDA